MLSSQSKFNAEIVEHGDVAVLRLLNQKYHADSHEALDAQFRDVEARTAAALIAVDLQRVTLLSSSALRAMRSAYQRVEARGGRIVAAGGGDLVRSVLKFAPFISHYETIDEAVSALAASNER